VAVVHSPAVTMALLTDTGARGPVARTTLGVVLITDVIVVLLFTAAVTVARSLVPAAGAGPSFGVVAWEILGALLVGGALAAAAALYLRFVGEELFLFALLFTLLGAEVAHLAHVETLLTLLVAGFIAENVSPRGAGEALRRAMERSAAPVFVVFFALSGAQMDLSAVLRFLPVLALLALVRAGALFGGTRLGARWAGVSGDERRLLWLGLVSQVGVAIGLASVLAGVFPTFGVELRTLLLAFIALNQLAGPVLFRRALVEAGEIGPSPAAVPIAADK
jgi:Kef-type K+ transport system membrane component KefB